MSYLLDALKQSEQGEVSREAQNAAQTGQHYSQQKDLNFYRKLAFSLLAVLSFVVILSVGFMAGRWFQESKVATPDVVKQGIVEAKNETLLTKPQAQTVTMPVQTAPVIVQQAMPTQYQLVPVQNTYSTLQAPTQQQQVPVTHYQNNAPVQNIQQAQVDYSQYKVVGKPIGQSSLEITNTEKKSEDSEIAKLPASLKTAFAKAVAATEKDDKYDVITATKNSAMAQPIQLLPDVIQSLIPTITYQAHIYATDASRRWIKLNGAELYEGDNLGSIKVLEIAPEMTLMSIEGYRFSISAMDDWLP